MKRLVAAGVPALILLGSSHAIAGAPAAAASNIDTIIIEFDTDLNMGQIYANDEGGCNDPELRGLTTLPVDAESLVQNARVDFCIEIPGFDNDDSFLFTFGDSWFSEFQTNPHRATGGNGQLTSLNDSSVTLQTCSLTDGWAGSFPGPYNCDGGNVDTYTVVADSPDPDPENGDSSSASGAGVVPAAHIQEFAKSPSMTCDEEQPEGLNWSGAPSGRWGESWAQWPNDGRGGEVCVRTLFYNTATGKWDVR